MPVFNAAEYLAKSLSSVLEQSFRDLEVICVDDGSTDASLEVLRRFQERDGRIHVIRSPVNAGPSAARNRGIEAARGEFLFFVDADDEIVPQALDWLLSAVNQTGCALAAGDFRWLRGPGDSLGNETYPPEIAPTVVDAATRFANGIPGHHGCNLYSRRLLEAPDAVSYPEDLVVGEDQLFQAAAILKAQKIAVIDRPVYVYHHYRSTSLSKTPPTLRRLLDDVQYRVRLSHLFASHGLGEAAARSMRTWAYSIREIWWQIPTALRADEVTAFFAVFRKTIRDARVEPPWLEWAPAEHREVLSLIVEGHDDAALRGLLGIAAQRAAEM